MARQVVFRPQAEDEVLEVRQWYEARRLGLGKELGQAIAILVTRIAENPLTFPLWEKNMINKPGSPESVTWEPLDGYDALAECRKTGQEHLKNALAYMNDGAGKLLGSVRPDGRSATFAVTDTAVGTPSTFDTCAFPGDLILDHEQDRPLQLSPELERQIPRA